MVATAVIGAGLMGHGIAQVLASTPGIVWIHDVSQAALDEAIAQITESLDLLSRYGFVKEPAEVLGRIRTTPRLAEAVSEAWLIVEAATEDLGIKQELFANIEAESSRNAIIATNTSGLRLADIAKRVTHQDRIVGSHFFMPAQVVPLVEVSRSNATSNQTMDTIVDHWKKCGKVPIRVERDIPGYVANRIQSALVREATALLRDGVASAEDIDMAVRMSFGLRYLVSGPLEQRDLGGLDLHLTIGREMWPHLDTTAGPHAFVEKKVAKGELGLKSGRGFYDWDGQDPETVRRNRMEALVSALERLRTPSGGNATC